MNAELAPAPAAADANNDHGHDHPAPSAGVAAQSDGQHARTQADVVSDDNQLLPDSDSICRVCRSPATPDDPLFHPCKCSGSMRFVHQQCLEDWLSHSGKRHCEICNHVFVFTPIYAESAPASVSASTVVSVVVQRLVAAATFSMRVVLAVVAWLVWVPYVTVWTWRLFLSPALIAERLMTTNSTFTLHYQLAQYIFNDTFAGSTSLVTILDGADWAKEWSATAKSLMADVFEGQKIASLAIVVGLSLVCIKEYIVLNTPRGPDGRPMLHPDDVDPDVALDADFHGLENPLDLHAPDAPDAGVDAQLDQLDGLELVQEAAAMDIIHADGQMRNDDHEQQEPDRRNVPPEPHLDGDHQNGQGEPAAWQSNAHGPPDGSDVQASSFTQHLRESPLASHALLHSREASDGVHSTQAVSPALSSRSSQHFYAHMDSQTDATSWSASFAQDSHPSGAPRDSVRHEFTYMRHFNQTHSTEFVSSSDEADIEMLPNDVSPGSSSGYGTPDAPRYYLRSRIDHPHSVAGSSSSLDEQVPRASSFSGSGSNERIVAPLPRSRASSGTDIPRFSLRRKASSRSTTVSSANSPASPVGVTAHPLPSAEDLQRRYADEMAALESEVDRRRLKGKQSACSGDDEPAGNAYPPFPPSSDDALVSASLQNARFRRDSGSDGQQHASSSQDTSDSAKPTSLRGSARSSASDSRHLSSSAPTPPTRITSGFREARDTYSSSRSSSRSSVDSTNPDWRDSLANLARRERESSAEVSRSLASSQSSSAVTNQALLSSSLVNAVAARPIERTRFSLRKNASDNHDEQSSLLAIGTSLPQQQQQQQQHDAHLDGVDGDTDTDTDTDPVARAESQLASGSIIAEDKCLPDALPPGPAHGRAHLQETQDGDALHGTVEHMPPNLQQLRQDHPILQDAQAWQERDIAGQLDAEQPEQQLEQQLEQLPEQQPEQAAHSHKVHWQDWQPSSLAVRLISRQMAITMLPRRRQP
ncbi:hypothetical protein BC831DRAFT_168403 [Entophlyctis helioformis]|nr:hypothetical protein BC831DRAFT_168403 [Entophlyctis helioformis]